jgi:hypothetical protein
MLKELASTMCGRGSQIRDIRRRKAHGNITGRLCWMEISIRRRNVMSRAFDRLMRIDSWEGNYKQIRRTWGRLRK